MSKPRLGPLAQRPASLHLESRLERRVPGWVNGVFMLSLLLLAALLLATHWMDGPEGKPLSAFLLEKMTD